MVPLIIAAAAPPEGGAMAALRNRTHVKCVLRSQKRASSLLRQHSLMGSWSPSALKMIPRSSLAPTHEA